MNSTQLLNEIKKQLELLKHKCYERNSFKSGYLLGYAKALQLQQTGVMRCSSKDIDKFYNDTMYTDQTNYYGVIQKTKKGDYVRWKQPSQMIKDFMRWKKNNA
jgi:hypothetical protein